MDARRTEFRKAIAEYALLNRPRDENKPPIPILKQSNGAVTTEAVSSGGVSSEAASTEAGSTKAISTPPISSTSSTTPP